MRQWIAPLALAALIALPGHAAAEAPDEDSVEEQNLEGWEALHDLEQAETDEEADEAKQRFEDASQRELQQRRQQLDDALER